VLTLSSRGFGNSCGAPASRTTPDCADGWIRLDDTRFEIRDVQHLAGLLADQGIVDPRRVGVHGGSYGGGVSMALGLLRDRIMDTDGSLKPWTSPKGRPMRIAAVAPYIPWSDLVYSLLPNGRNLDYLVPKPRESYEPFGFMKETFVSALYASGEASGLYAPPGADPDADLRRWFPRVNAGDPYDGDPTALDIVEKIYRFKSNIAIPRDRQPAPLFVANGWTDDLFPGRRGRSACTTRFQPRAPADAPFAMDAPATSAISAGQTSGPTSCATSVTLVSWMDRYVEGDADGTRSGRRRDRTPRRAPRPRNLRGGPFSAPCGRAAHRRGPLPVAVGGTVTRRAATGRRARHRPGRRGGNNPCVRTSAADEPGTMNVRMPAAGGRRLHADGRAQPSSPTSTVTGRSRSSTRGCGTSRPTGSRRSWPARSSAPTRRAAGLPAAPQRLPLRPGHVAKLQLLGRDARTRGPANSPFSIAVTASRSACPWPSARAARCSSRRRRSCPPAARSRPSCRAGRRRRPQVPPMSPVPPRDAPPAPVPGHRLPRRAAARPDVKQVNPTARSASRSRARAAPARRRAPRRDRPQPRRTDHAGRQARRAARRRAQLYLVAGCRGVRLRGPDVKKVKRVTVFKAGMRRRHDRRIPFRVALRGRGRTVRALAVKRNGRSVRLRTTVPRGCR
jgi:hypothetical protein